MTAWAWLTRPPTMGITQKRRATISAFSSPTPTSRKSRRNISKNRERVRHRAAISCSRTTCANVWSSDRSRRRRAGADHLLSTFWGQAGIVVSVHSVPRCEVGVLQLQLPRSGPNGQPPESSHLEQDGRRLGPVGKSCEKLRSPGGALLVEDHGVANSTLIPVGFRPPRGCVATARPRKPCRRAARPCGPKPGRRCRSARSFATSSGSG